MLLPVKNLAVPLGAIQPHGSESGRSSASLFDRHCGCLNNLQVWFRVS